MAAGSSGRFWLVVIGGFLIALGGILVPQYVDARTRQREAALATALERLNAAFIRYRADHGGRWPGLTVQGLMPDLLDQQIALPTNPDGELRVGGACGPYLPSGIPPNPWNGSRDVRLVTDPELPAVDGSTGWVFHLPTGQLHSNARLR